MADNVILFPLAAEPELRRECLGCGYDVAEVDHYEVPMIADGRRRVVQSICLHCAPMFGPMLQQG